MVYVTIAVHIVYPPKNGGHDWRRGKGFANNMALMSDKSEIS